MILTSLLIFKNSFLSLSAKKDKIKEKKSSHFIRKNPTYFPFFTLDPMYEWDLTSTELPEVDLNEENSTVGSPANMAGYLALKSMEGNGKCDCFWGASEHTVHLVSRRKAWWCSEKDRQSTATSRTVSDRTVFPRNIYLPARCVINSPTSKLPKNLLARGL